MNLTTVKPSQQHVPVHLRQYLAEQNYDNYTPINQAVWRFVMRQNTHFLKGKAHEAFVSGLKTSGIKVDTLPRVEEMNASLKPFGLGAAIIGGFIPGVAFFDFQAHGILPIAVDIRKLENIKYTPAPDIIHEAAGHAPILCDPEYAEYVKVFGEIGSKAIATKEEHDVFDAVKHLSSIMESGTATAEDIQQAKQVLGEKLAAATEVSEAELVSRLYWWTVEYGLVGTLSDPKLYGAGLLSSIDEGMNALTDKVKKFPFDLDHCIETPFDITTQQPQLFVCHDFEQLIGAIKELSKRMAFTIGGTESLEKAVNSGHLATAVFSSGLQVSGTINQLERDPSGEAVYLKTTGPTSLSVNGKELPGHDFNRHRDGFGSPIGMLSGADKPLEHFSKSDLQQFNIAAGKLSELNFSNGVTVAGTVQAVHKELDRIVLMTFSDCSVSFDGKELFKPEWGEFDMAVGSEIVSVFAGAADNEAFYKEEIEKGENSPEDVQEHVSEWTPLDSLYQTIREIRENAPDGHSLEEHINAVKSRLDNDFPADWLLRVEMLEIIEPKKILPELSQSLRTQLNVMMSDEPGICQLIENGLTLIDKNL